MKNSKKWFTLVEALISLAVLTITIPIVWNFLVWLQQKSYLNQLKAQTISNVSILNSTISWIIRNSYWISYADTDTSWNTHTLVLFNDKLEKSKTKLFVQRDIEYDLSRIYIQIDWTQPVPLHSSHMFVEEFRINYTPKPVNTSTSNIQPWVSFDIKARSRSPLEQPTDDSYYDNYNKTETSLYGRVLIRNYVPSSMK